MPSRAVMGATDETAAVAHSQYPIGSDSWCRFQVAIAQGSRRPKHPNYLGREAVELVKEVFDHYNYDKDFFVDQIADGQTSNHNEALHHILFNIIPKTNAISYTTMRLGSALAVLRYNGGFNDLLEIFEILGVSHCAGLQNLFCEQDKKRVSDSFRIQEKMKQRFQDRQTRSKKEAGKIQKHGAGYSSGSYAASSMGHPQASLGDGAVRTSDEPTNSKSHDAGGFGAGETSVEEIDEDEEEMSKLIY